VFRERIQKLISRHWSPGLEDQAQNRLARVGEARAAPGMGAGKRRGDRPGCRRRMLMDMTWLLAAHFYVTI
jgi:hypothetical protein